MEATLEAIARDTIGKNEARRTRREGRVPAVVYGAATAGASREATPIAVDPKALLLLMNSFPAVPREALDAFDMPIMVMTGDQDRDNGSAKALADAIPNATYVEVPGNHMSSVTVPDLGDALARWF